MKNIQPYATQLMDFFQKKYDIKKKPAVYFQQDTNNSQNPLGKTAHYDPNNQSITIYITGRHVKDCLRSLAHELVHHLQNERGDLTDAAPTVPGYAQKDKHMRSMEREAYEKGNMCFRDWEDALKAMNKTSYNTDVNKGDVRMSIKEWRNTEMGEMLMEKWGFAPKEGSFLAEGMGSYDLSNADYATGELEETPENLEEEELGEAEAIHPQSTEAKQEVLDEKEELEEQKLRTTIRDIIKELANEK